jgi:hypothetical protein
VRVFTKREETMNDRQRRDAHNRPLAIMLTGAAMFLIGGTDTPLGGAGLWTLAIGAIWYAQARQSS